MQGILSVLIQGFSAVKVNSSALNQDFSAEQVYLSALHQGSVVSTVQELSGFFGHQHYTEVSAVQGSVM